MQLLLKCNLVELLKCAPTSVAREMEFSNAGVHKTGIDRNCTNARGRACIPLSIPAFSDSALSTTAMESDIGPSLQRGDLVRLRSGGPLMTIGSIKGTQVDCFWTGLDGEPNAESFPADVLKKF